MSDPLSPNEQPQAAVPAESDPQSAKAPWRAPKLEEVHYSATEAAGVGDAYDMTIYVGSA